MAVLTTLLNFNGTNGVSPYAGLIADAAGDLFGTTYSGGANNAGTVFELVNNGGSYTPTTLVNFNEPNGGNPQAGLIADAAGDLFGTTLGGGANFDGTVFELVNNGGGNYTPTTLVNFNATNGQYPSAGLIADAAGDLFGTTQYGGANGDGTVFELVNNGGGSYTPTTLVSFNGTNGANPVAGLIADAAGDLFGTTQNGGAVNAGTVFELVNNGGGSYTPTTLVSFNSTNGATLFAGLIADAAGDLFGTTTNGGANGDGTVFELVNNGGGNYTPTTLLSFNGTNGAHPLMAGLIADAAGDLFGTTFRGGANGFGTVFELVNNGGGNYTPTTLVNFNATNGQYPQAGLIADAAGDLFGTTQYGGANGDGTVFELSGLDQDTGEQAALSLAVNGGHPIGAATASAVPFTVSGLESDDNGTVSFSDGSHAPVPVAITNGVLAATTVNLAGLNDGPITATLHLNNDPSGNTFTDVATNAALDQDSTEQAALSLAVNGGHPIGAATASAVPFTVSGLESDDNGTVSFSDGSHAPVPVAITNGVLAATTVNLAGLNDGPITATLHLNNDPSGNTFTDVATNAALDQDSTEQAALKLTVNNGQPIGAATASAVPFTVSALESDDNGTVSFSDGSHAPVVVNIANGVPAASTATLTGLNDGTIAATLHLNNDAAGNFPGGSFQPAPSLLIGSSPIAITTADVNGDGKTDLVVANQGSDTVSVLLGNGDGTFQPQQTYATGPVPVGIATADVNGDGKADLLVTNNSANTVSVLLGNGDGTFQAQQTYATGISPQGITTADVNGDGKVDLLVANAFGNTVGVLLGNGDGTFQVQQAYGTGGTSPGTARITTADVNRDGKVDILVTEVNTNIVSVLLGNGDGTFQAPQTYATGPGPQGVTTADVNGDGNVDLMVANWRSNNVSVLLGNGDGTFQAQQTYATGNNPFGITTADVNGDGKTDLVVTNQGSDTVSVLLGNGDGTFQAQQTYAAGSSPFGITTADVNGDGRPDIAVADASGNTVTVLLNQASATASASFTIDRDSGEQAVLKLTVNNGQPIGAAIAGAVPFTVGGLESDDSGTVSFSDGSHAAVVVDIVNGVPAATTANLAGLNDGPITATLHLDNDAAGNAFANFVTTATLDQVPPTVTAMTASPNSGDLNTGSVITLTLTMSKSVTVTGTPALTLNDGGVATYTSGSGSNKLIFTYTVANAQNASALAVTGNNLNGSTVKITDAAGVAADLSGADVTFPGLAIGATVTSISASPSAGDLGPGTKVVFAVSMSEAVKVSGGTPFLSLNDGGKATYKSGSGTNVLTFSYTVGATGSGQNTASLAVTGFNPNGGTVYDSNIQADSADLSGVTGFTSGPQIDTTAPVVASVLSNPATADLDAGKTVTLTVQFSKAVIVNTTAGTPSLNLNASGGKAIYSSGSGSNTLVFSYVVAAGQNTADLIVNSLALNGGSITDGLGNKAVLTGAGVNPAGILQIDTTPPQISSVVASPTTADLNAGKTVALTVNFKEAVNVTGGTPFLTLSDGGTAAYTTGTGSNALTFTYVVANAQNTADLTVTGLTLPGSTTIQDNAGNNAVLTGAVTNPAGTLQIDTIAPTVSAVTTSPTSGQVNTNHAVTISLAMSEKVTETGAPVLLLNDGGTATYKSGSGGSTLNFNYTVASGQVTSDLRVAGIVLSSPSAIADLAGNAANLSAAGADTKLGINTPPGSSSGPSGGNFTISGSTDLELFSASSAKVTFEPGDTGTLTLDKSQNFTGTVGGLALGNYLDLTDIAFGANTTLGYAPNAGNTGGTLTVSDATHAANILLLGNYMAGSFVKSNDGGGHTLITDPPMSEQAMLVQPHHS